MNITERLKKQEEELESRLFGTPEDQEKKPEDAPEETPDLEAAEKIEEVEDAAPEKEDTPKGPEPSEMEAIQEKLAQTEKRFFKYKASTDKTIHELRQENTALSSNLAEALEELGKLQEEVNKVDVSDPFTADDEKVVGPEAMKILRKLHSDAVRPYIEQQRKAKAQEIEKLKSKKTSNNMESRNAFVNDLTDSVPNWRTIVKEDAFKEFMKTEKRGITFDSRFRNAEAKGDSDTCADIFFDYLDSRKVGKKEDNLDEHVSVKQSSTPVKEKPKGKGQVTQKEIEDHFNRVKSGYYLKNPDKLADARRVEKAIDAMYR